MSIHLPNNITHATLFLGFYAEGVGYRSYCDMCPQGFTTAGKGATSEDECVQVSTYISLSRYIGSTCFEVMTSNCHKIKSGQNYKNIYLSDRSESHCIVNFLYDIFSSENSYSENFNYDPFKFMNNVGHYLKTSRSIRILSWHSSMTYIYRYTDFLLWYDIYFIVIWYIFYCDMIYIYCNMIYILLWHDIYLL